MKPLCKLKSVFKAIYSCEQKLKQEVHLTINECLALCCVFNGERNAGEIAGEIGISPSRISRILGSLEKKELIIRLVDENDKRKMIFELSLSGKTKMDMIKNVNMDFSELNFISEV
ncbi:MAG: MarR family transcriptional regulator [Candidatus Margulisiibacteriota bacterium]|nr:MAG: hypothetical protein A2X43_02745 [Candidatus Margulisbacteria bacterium GWD2_39_127]OGI02751.1 MAG: hypothetical protein A2X42_01780 [Candidatus Margulisbacteria bacterium GWF2_38_17]OGI09363.1 MAG: hypothetical protein A2X41_09595 [Candidatus Margulisbacteria bacterium GWE2_39_32]PZM84940.1 MAG: MarR family transcriptional regulator [Candidatus Margulisiibacteriota bacterium]HAR63654.1 MarR family transcriptional regulator [Candidatus Margulisiibacteriota bacterium]